MKQITAFILLLSLAACNPESSPEGRARIRHEKVERKLDSLLEQNHAIMDSIHVINKELTELKSK